jgi:hypothetical protein
VWKNRDKNQCAKKKIRIAYMPDIFIMRLANVKPIAERIVF